MFSSAVTINSNYALPRLCQRLRTLWSVQHWGNYCNYPTKSLDKLAIKICKLKKYLNIFCWLRLRLLHEYLNFFVLYMDAFRGHHIAKKLNLFLMKLTLLQVGKQQELPELLQYPLYGYDVTISIIISIDQDIIQVNNNKDVKLLRKDLVDISLKAC